MAQGGEISQNWIFFPDLSMYWGIAKFRISIACFPASAALAAV
jgi:hypothetical protein